MIARISLVLNVLAAFFKSKSRLEAENAALRQQLIMLQRKLRGRLQFDKGDRLFFVQNYRWFPSHTIPTVRRTFARPVLGGLHHRAMTAIMSLFRSRVGFYDRRCP